MRPRLSLRNAVITAALVEGGLLLGLALYLAVTGRALVIAFPTREERWRAEASAGLAIPVAGVRVEELKDTWGEARSGGRVHRGIDIFAPRGTPVVAAAAGIVVQRDTAGAGGIAVHQRDLDGRTVYYYAHLDRHRPGLKEGDLVRQGDVIGYVGSTGNVSGSPHLHFAVFTVTNPNHLARGRELNPYPLLRAPASPAGEKARAGGQ